MYLYEMKRTLIKIPSSWAARGETGLISYDWDSKLISEVILTKVIFEPIPSIYKVPSYGNHSVKVFGSQRGATGVNNHSC